jgi:hypothetical protein
LLQQLKLDVDIFFLILFCNFGNSSQLRSNT